MSQCSAAACIADAGDVDCGSNMPTYAMISSTSLATSTAQHPRLLHQFHHQNQEVSHHAACNNNYVPADTNSEGPYVNMNYYVGFYEDDTQEITDHEGHLVSDSTYFESQNSPDHGRVGDKIWCCLALWKMVTSNKVFSRLRKKLNQQTIKILDTIVSKRIRLTTLLQKIKYWKKCIDEELIPPKVLNRLNKPSLYAAKKLMDRDVQRWNEEKEKVVHELMQYRTLTNTLTFYSFSLFNKYSLHITNKVRVDVWEKLSRSTSVSPPFLNIMNANNVVNNKSDYVLSDVENYAPSFGQKFCIPRVE